MQDIKVKSRKYHAVLGVIFALPLLLSSVTAVLYVIFEEVLHNEELAKYAMKFHTLDIIGLEDVYPFIFLIGTVGLVVTGLILFKKNYFFKPDQRR